jgi:hypothetical protein
LNKYDVLSFYLSNGGLLSWKDVVDWANSNGFGKYFRVLITLNLELNLVKQIHIELISEELLCQKIKGPERTASSEARDQNQPSGSASVSMTVNFN